MRRDMDLLRELMLVIEAETTRAEAFAKQISIDGVDRIKVEEHLLLLSEMDLIEAKTSVTNRGTVTFVVGLTSAGHDFIEQARDDALWNAARGRVKDAVQSASIEVLKKVLVSTALKKLGIDP